MQIKVNGKFYNFNDKITLEDIINQLNILSHNIIAEVNGQVITKEKFNKTVIENNSIIELIKFVGGG